MRRLTGLVLLCLVIALVYPATLLWRVLWKLYGHDPYEGMMG